MHVRIMAIVAAECLATHIQALGCGDGGCSSQNASSNRQQRQSPPPAVRRITRCKRVGRGAAALRLHRGEALRLRGEATTCCTCRNICGGEQNNMCQGAACMMLRHVYLLCASVSALAMERSGRRHWRLPQAFGKHDAHRMRPALRGVVSASRAAGRCDAKSASYACVGLVCIPESRSGRHSGCSFGWWGLHAIRVLAPRPAGALCRPVPGCTDVVSLGRGYLGCVVFVSVSVGCCRLWVSSRYLLCSGPGAMQHACGWTH